MALLSNRSDLLNRTMLSHTVNNFATANASFGTSIKAHNPLFSEAEFIERLMKTYGIKHVVDLVNTNTFVQDNMLSYLIVTRRYYIILIKSSLTRLVIRDKCNVYMDSVIKNDWRVDVLNSNNNISFNITCLSITTYLFYINSNAIYFNKSLLGCNNDTVLRIVAAKS